MNLFFKRLKQEKNIRFSIITFIIVIIVLIVSLYFMNKYKIINTSSIFNSDLIFVQSSNKDSADKRPGYIKWVEFDVPLQVLNQALTYDISSYNELVQLNWIELIAYGAAKNWGSFAKEKKCRAIDEVVVKLKNGEKMVDLAKDLKKYAYYLETYSAVLGGYVGEFEIEEKDPSNPNEKIKVRKYGLKAFSPVAKNYNYSHYDDFGVSRSYGYKRKHLGNDIMGNVGTPIIAVEDGYVEALGWNKYGGWRIGIRTYDKKRYYYYAHLRKDHPFNKALKEGSHVNAGDVIGYLGMTGYSTKENVNNIVVPHLHFGIQLIFDESQKDGVNQIWIDLYNLVNFLAKNKMPVYKNNETKDFERSINITNIVVD